MNRRKKRSGLQRVLAIVLCTAMVLSNQAPMFVLADTNTKVGQQKGTVEEAKTAVPESETSGIPETAVPETAVPDTAVPETAVPEAVVPEEKVPEAVVPEEKVPEEKAPETVLPVLGTPEVVPEEITTVVYVDPSKVESQDGKTIDTPVNSLEQALTLAMELRTKTEQEITITVLSPIIIEEQKNASFDGQGIHLVNGGGNTTMFQIKGGQLTLSHMTLIANETKDQAIVRIEGGTLIIEEDLRVESPILYDYEQAGEQLPTMLVAKELAKDSTYQIRILGADTTNGAAAITAVYEDGEAGAALQHHFNIEEADAAEWKFTTSIANEEAERNQAEETSKTLYFLNAQISLFAAASPIYWNSNAKDLTDTDGTVKIHGGNDLNDGSAAQYPVLTWEKAKEKAIANKSYTIVYMSNTNMDDAESAGIASIFTIDGATGVAGKNITLQQWETTPEDAFLIPENTELTLQNITLQKADGMGKSTMIRIIKGKLNIGTGVVINGQIQEELSAVDKTWVSPINVIASIAAGVKYEVYFSEINDNLTNLYADVIQPVPDTDSWKLADHFTLAQSNTDAGWNLRYDADDGTDAENTPNTLELYKDYTYDAIYLDGERGDDKYFGGSCKFPVKTFAQAKKLLKEKMSGSGVIFVCGAVTVDDTQTWSLPSADYPDAKVVLCTHVASDGSFHAADHKDPTNPDAADQGIASIMVRVTGTGNLTTDHITLEYPSNQSYSSSIMQVEDGGIYTMNEGTLLTGGTAVTYGVGIRADGAAQITLNGDAATTGIRNRNRGIYFTGKDKATSKLTMTGASISGMDCPSTTGKMTGAGVDLSQVTMTMTGGEIKGNTVGGTSDSYSYNKYGGGIYASSSQLDISGGSITGNRALSYNDNSYYNGYGGGIALSSSVLNISGSAAIGDNTATTRGGGIYAIGSSAITMTDGAITGNRAEGGYSSYVFGGGIYTEGATALTITKGSIESNTSQRYGGGVYIAASGSGATSTFSSGASITGNTATDYPGGGVYIAGSSKVEFDGASITGNQASNGGGIYNGNANSSYPVVIKNDTKIQDNTATGDGGGIYSYGYMDVESATISGNQAGNGAGIYSYAYTNRILDATISGNTATGNGGGIYAYCYYTSQGFTMKGGTITGNTAASGPSLYTVATTNLLGGSIPDAVEKDIVVNVSAGSGYPTRIDPEHMTLSNHKDKIYLATASSKLSLLGGVSDNDAATTGSLKVALNPAAFKTGSIVVIPGGEITLEGTTYTGSDVSKKSLYFTGGTIPEGTQLGGFNQNIILVGEGVYLDGTNGEDTNAGTSPTTAVRTFSQAKTLLQQYVAEHEGDAGDADGFLPYIYICGEVPITGTETWELDAADPANNPTKNDIEPQVIRFASYYGKMVSVAGTGAFTVDRLFMNGNHVAVDGALNDVKAMIDVVTGGTVTLLEGSKIWSNYTSAIVMKGGTLTMSGTGTGAEVGGGRSYGIEALADADLILTENAHVVNPYLTTGNSNGAVALTGTGTTMKMGGASYVSARGYTGISVSNQAVLAMKEDAYIQDAGTGISSSAVVTMEGNSHITQFSIGIQQTDTAQTTMSGSTFLTGGGSSSGIGVKITAATQGNTLTLQDDAKIEEVYQGISLESSVSKAVVTLANQAKIENATYGLYNYLSGRGENQLILSDTAHISGCTTAGVYSSIYYSNSGKLLVEMRGNAYLGGTAPGPGAVQGNNYGIVDSGTGTDLTMRDNASIQYNTRDGVYILGSSYSSLQGIITLSDAAKIAFNGSAGIQSEDNNTSYGSAITLSDTAAITDNGTRGVYLQKQSSLTLGAGTAVSGNKAGTDTEGAAIYAAGKLNLSGEAEVDQEIYLRESKNPISLTSAVAKEKIFQVGYHENFVGQTVVMPSGSITDATTYYDNFAAAAHIPTGKGMISKTPNIVVQGENNVYLAGTATSGGVVPGDDRNNGMSPGSPVRTFQRAKELLQDLDTGANIYICNAPIVIGSNDTDWSFDAGGTFTNQKKETWTPKIIRHEKYTGIMIQLSGTAIEMNHLTLDGNGEKVTASGAIVEYTSTVSAPVTIQNCTFENAKSSNYGGAIYNYAYGLDLRITDSIFRNNQASYGGAIAQRSGSSIKTTVSGCTFTGNTANNYGGAIYAEYGTIAISDSQMTKNQAANGSAIYTTSYTSSLTMADTSITENIATTQSTVYLGSGTNQITGGEISKNQNTYYYNTRGVGIHNAGGTLTLDGVAICENVASTQDTSYYAYGLGIYNTATLIMKGGLLEGNTRPTAGSYVQGAGIYNTGTFTLTGGSIKGNGAGAGNVTGAGVYNGGNLTIQGGSIEGNGAGAANVTGGGVYQGGGTFKMSGGSVTGNIGTTGAAIAHMGGTTTMEGGLISGNQAPTVTRAGITAANAPVSVNTSNFIIKGGAATISDQIYLSSPSYPIILSGSIYQRGRLYDIVLADAFIKGNTVVQPDGEVIQNATQYHKYFTAQRNGCILEKSQPNLILKQCIFLNSEIGADINTGATPAEAVATFAEARRKAGENALIFVSGPVTVTGTENWTLPATTSICRYVGFPVSGVKYDGYFGPMIVTDTGDALTMDGLSIYGRRDIDGVYYAEAVCQVGADSTVTAKDTTIMRNDNSKKSDILSAQGGAFKVEKGGTLSINGGTIKGNAALDGQAIYMDGTLQLDGSPLIEGDVYLTGTGIDDATSSYITPAVTYSPPQDTLLELNIENPYNNRQVVQYPTGVKPAATEKAYYQLDSNVMALFRFENRKTGEHILELQQKGFVYVDGTTGGHGDDAHDGTTPEQAVKTLKQAYTLLQKEHVGGLISVVGTVTIAETTSMKNSVVGDTYLAEYTDASGTVDAGGAVYLRRYAQPTGWEKLTGYNVPSNTGNVLKIVNNGALTLDSLTVDGHSEALTGLPALTAAGVEADAALVEVETGGSLICEQYCQFINNNNTATDGKGGALYINGGSASLKRTNILQVAAAKGSAVYQDGTFAIAYQPKMEGSVYLTGKGTATGGNSDTSKSIDVSLNGFRPQSGTLEVEVEDPYNGRTIATYPTGGKPTVDDSSIYQLSDEINAIYIIGSRAAEPNVLELKYRPAVYVDGVNGSDSNTGLAPDTSVKTLKQAYTLLKKSGGGVLYVVDTITISTETSLTGKSYTADTDKIEIVGTPTEVRRYAQPDAHAGYTGFTHTSNAKPLFLVAGTATLHVDALTIDGHKNPRTDTRLSPSMIVAGTTKANGPAILVEAGGNLNLNPGTVIKDNHNIDTTTALAGGAVGNFGTTVFTDTVLQDNEASKGAGIYQHGSFTLYGADGLGQQEIYLATNNTGSENVPVWGEDYVIHVQEKLKDTVALHVNVDHPVRGRNITIFDRTEAFTGDVSNEIPRFHLGNTVPNTLSFTKSETEVNTLELQNYDVTYDGNGSTAGTAPVDGHSPYTKDAEVTVLEKADLAKTNAHFVGWNTKADGTGTHYNPAEKFSITKNTTLYAMWLQYEKTAVEETPGDAVLRPDEQLTYTIKVTMPEAAADVTVEDSIPANTTYVTGSATETPTVTDEKLTWTTGAVQAAQELTFQFAVKVNKGVKQDTNITNTAVIQLAGTTYDTNTTTNTVGKTFSVLYDANGASTGTAPVDEGIYIETETATVLTQETLSKTNATFMGWNTKADGTGTHYNAGDTTAALTDEITLYAMWVLAEKTSVEETPADHTLKPGEKLTYTIHVEVPEAKTAVITDVIPTGTTYVAGSANESGTYDETTKTVTWNLTTTKQTAKDLQFAVTVDTAAVAATQITNQAKVVIDAVEYTSNEKQDSVGTTYQVRYQANTADTGSVPMDAYLYAADEVATVQDSKDLAKTSHVFIGWNSKADGSGTAYAKDDTITMKENVTLYAMWMKAEKSAVEGEMGNGLKPDEILTYTIAIAMPETTAADVVVTDRIPSGTDYVDGSANEGGTFDKGVITWTFENKAAGTTKTLSFQVKVKDTAITSERITNIATITIGDNTYNSTSVENQVVETFRVTYDGNTSESGTDPVDTKFYAANDSATVVDNLNFVKTEHVFVGWNTKADGSGTAYAKDDTITMSQDVTLYAMWMKVAKTAVEENQGTGLKPNEILTYQIALMIPQSTGQIIVRDTMPMGTTYVENSVNEGGVYDKGVITWTFANAAAGTTKNLSFQVQVNADVAADTAIRNTAEIQIGGNTYQSTSTENQVIPTYQIRYVSNGADEETPPSDTHLYAKDEEASVADGTSLSKTNASFSGWNTKADGTGTHYESAQSIPMTENVQLYAMWTGAVKVSEQENTANILKPREKLTYTIQVETPEPGSIVVTDVIPDQTSYLEGSANEGGVYDSKTRTITWKLDATQKQGKSLTFEVQLDPTTVEHDVIRNTAKVAMGKKSWDSNAVTDTVGETFRVTYDGNQQTSGTVPFDDGFYAANDEATALEGTSLIKTNGRFSGWNTEANGTGRHYEPGDPIMTTGNLTLYAMWTVAEKSSKEEISADATLKPGEELTYTIHVEVPEAKTALITDQIPKGTTYVETSANEGGTYDEGSNTVTWNLTTTEKTVKDFSFRVKVEDNIDPDIQIKNAANVQIDAVDFPSNGVIDTIGKTYIVIYNQNGAETGMAPEDSYLYAADEVAKVQDNQNLAKADHVFVGWNSEPDGSGNAYAKDDSITMKENMTLYAMWMKAAKTAVEGETGNGLKPNEILTYQIAITMPEKTADVVVTDAIPTGTTYVENSANEGGSYKDGVITWTFANAQANTAKELSFQVKVNADITQGSGVSNTAEIQIGENTYHSTTTEAEVVKTYHVMYDGNTNDNGSVPLDTKFYAENDIAVVQDQADLAKANYVFIGWNTKADGSGDAYAKGDRISIKEDMTLYAMWMKAAKTAVEGETGNGLKPNEILTYQIAIAMPEKTAEVVVTDAIPTGTTYVENSANEGGSYQDGVITWRFANTEVNTAKELSFQVKVNAALTEGSGVSNTAAIQIGDNTYHSTTTEAEIVKTYHVTYHGNTNETGSVPLDTTFYAENDIAVIQDQADIAKANHVFIGWNSKADGSGDAYATGDRITVKEEVNLYAMWMKAAKTAVEGETGNGLKPNEILTYQIAITMPEKTADVVVTDAIPTGTTYVENSANEGGSYQDGVITWRFANAQANTAKELSFQVKVNADITEGSGVSNTAAIQIGDNTYHSTTTEAEVVKTYHVTYHGNTNETGSVPLDTKFYAENDTAVVQDQTDLAKANYVFIGWNTKADGTGDAYAKGDRIVMKEEVNLYAMWMKAVKTAVEGDSENILKPGEELTYTIDVVIPEKTDKVVVVDDIPQGTTYVDGSANENGVYEDGKLTWTLEDNAVGSEKQLSFTVTVDRVVIEGTGIANTAEITIGENKYSTTTAENTVGKTYTLVYDGSNSDAGQAPVDLNFYAQSEQATVLGNVGAQLSRAVGDPMSKDNATFAGWNTRKDGTGAHYEANDLIEMTSDLTLYAMWNQAYKESTTVDGKPMIPGTILEYKITVKAADNTQKITVTDAIPEGTTYVEGSASDKGVYADKQITWNFTDLPVGTVLELTFQVQIADLKPNTEIFNQAKITIVTDKEVTIEQETNKVTDQVIDPAKPDTKPTEVTKPTPPTKPTQISTSKKKTVKTGDSTNVGGLLGMLGLAGGVVLGVLGGRKYKKKKGN